MLKKVFFYGDLKDRYGEMLQLSVNSVSDIVSLMQANFQDFRKTLFNGRYAILRGESTYNYIECLTEDQLRLNYTEGDWHIIPETSGAGGSMRGMIMFIVGAAIAVVGTYFGQPWATSMGVGIALGGVAAMLTKVHDYQSEEVDHKPSLIYTGGVNTVEQGGPVPLVYGQIMAGSVIISSDIDSYERADREIGQAGEIK